MRTVDTVYFVKNGEEVYDPETGNYETGETERTAVQALVTDTGVERMNLLYGGIRKHAKTVRLNQRLTGKFDSVEIDGRSYQIDRVQTYRQKQSYEVSSA